MIDQWIYASTAGLLGLLIGSFLNVCIYRLPRDLSVWNPPRSFCPQCEKTIAWYDNLPILSYVRLRGRCRWCQAPIPSRYLLVEWFTGMLFFASVWTLGASPAASKYCTFFALQIGLIFADLEERILPDEFTWGGVLAGLVFAWFIPLQPGFASLFLPLTADAPIVSVAEAALAAGFTAGSLLLLRFLYEKIRGQEGLGLGDVKMMAAIGAFLGLMPSLLAVMLGSLLGSVLGLLYIRWQKQDSATYELPFGSFLGIGAIASAWLQIAGY